ncbi:MAG TPA: preprotein translocase subunit TatB [Catenuloplanes sp.]|jgi:sec-independent protein translocase protein TatB
MFENLNWWEIGALLLLALLIFGDRLPNVIADGLKMLRNLRTMARNATGDLSRELGTDIQLEDLHPKAFIRKHLLSEEDEEALRKPIKGLYDDIRADLDDVNSELKDVASVANARPTGRTGGAGARTGATVSDSPGAASAATPGQEAGAAARPSTFDADAT